MRPSPLTKGVSNETRTNAIDGFPAFGTNLDVFTSITSRLGDQGWRGVPDTHQAGVCFVGALDKQ